MRLYLISLIFLSISLSGQQDTTIYLDDCVNGTLSVPAHFTSGEIALIVAGSGPTDRDGNNPYMKNNSLRMLSTELNQSGIATLRYDKRGIGKSISPNLKEEDLKFDDYVNDVILWIKVLRQDQRFTRLTIIGHSEGAHIGAIAASHGSDKLISLAGPGRPAQEIIIDQLRDRAPILVTESQKIIDKLVVGDTTSTINPFLNSLFRPSVQPYLISWFRHDPVKDIARLTIPILIVQGDKDIQVKEDDARLLHEAQPNSKLLIINGMTHVLKIIAQDDGLSANMATYSDPDAPISKELISQIVSFILNQ